MTIMSISKTVMLYNLLPITYAIDYYGKDEETGKCVVKVTIALNAEEDDNWKLQSNIAESGLPLLGEPLNHYWGELYCPLSQRERSKEFYGDTYEEAYEKADKFVLKELEDIDKWRRIAKDVERRSE